MKANFDVAGRLDLIFRNSRAGSKTLTFVDSDGNPYSLEGLTFQLIVKSYKNPSTIAFQLSQGSGLNVGVNTIEVYVTGTETNQPEHLHFWELYETTSNETWIFGDVQFITKQPKEADEIEVIVRLVPDEITVTVTGGSNAGRLRGGFAAVDDVYPDEAAVIGDKWYSTQDSTFNGQFYSAKHFFEALESNPGNDHTKWRIY